MGNHILKNIFQIFYNKHVLPLDSEREKVTLLAQGQVPLRGPALAIL